MKVRIADLIHGKHVEEVFNREAQNAEN